MNIDYSTKVIENMYHQLDKSLERKRQLESQRSDIDALIDDTNAVIQGIERFISTLHPRVYPTRMPNTSHMEEQAETQAGNALETELRDVSSHLQ